LLSGGLMLPVVALFVTAGALGALALPTGVALLIVGLSALLIARAPIWRAGQVVQQHSAYRRTLYWVAAGSAACGVVFAVAGIAFH